MFNRSRRNVNCFQVEWCTIQLMAFIRTGERIRINIVAGIRCSGRSWVVAPWKFESWKIVVHIYCSTYTHTSEKFRQTIPNNSDRQYVGGNNRNIRGYIVVSINQTRLDRYRTLWNTFRNRYDYKILKIKSSIKSKK